MKVVDENGNTFDVPAPTNNTQIYGFNGLHTDEDIAQCQANAQMELTLTSEPQNATAPDAQPSDSNEDSSSSE